MSLNVQFRSKSGNVSFQIDDETHTVLMICPGEGSEIGKQDAMMAISLSPDEFLQFEQAISMVALHVCSYATDVKVSEDREFKLEIRPKSVREGMGLSTGPNNE